MNVKNSIATKLGYQISQIRKSFNLSQNELGVMIDRSAETISRIERGIVMPSMQFILRLSEALNLPLIDFFDFEERRRAWDIELKTLTIQIKNYQGHTIERTFGLDRCTTCGRKTNDKNNKR